MNINELTIGQAKELASLFGGAASVQSHPWEIGKNYFIRTVTFHYTGTLQAVHANELVLMNAAWIADDGRFTQALQKEDFSEVEMFPGRPVIIGRGSVIDAVEINKLPSDQK